MKLTAGPNLPNIFLVDISSRELDGVKRLLSQQPAVEGDVETLPSVAGRIISVDGIAADGLKLKNYPQRLLQTVSLTWSAGLPVGSNDGAGNVVGPGRWAITRRERAYCAAAALASRFPYRVHLEWKNHSSQCHCGHTPQRPACVLA
jgi:predicted lysophospholipase L1 biosynthesis ABC-type transport system permease subunit